VCTSPSPELLLALDTTSFLHAYTHNELAPKTSLLQPSNTRISCHIQVSSNLHS
jgi:hypothetical protein